MTPLRVGALLLCFSFVCGVYIQQVLFGMYAWSVLCIVACALYGVYGTVRAPLALFVVGTACACGVIVYTHALYAYEGARHEVARAVNDEADTFVGRIVSDGDERDKERVYRVVISSYGADESTLSQSATHPSLLLFAPRSSVFHYGDGVKIRGKAQTAFPPKNDVHAFDYPAYLRVQGVVGVVRSTSIDSVDVPAVSRMQMVWNEGMRALLSLKERMRAAVRASIDEPYASLGLGIVLGDAHGLLAHEYAMFTESGLSHIVVLSGYNVTVLILCVLFLLARAPRWIRFSSAACVATLCVAIAGWTAPALRALGMAYISVVGLSLYRTTAALMSLVVVSVCMVAWNPFLLRDSASFHLSFLATLGVIVFGASFSKWAERYVGAFMGVLLGTTCAASVYTLPYIAWAFGTMSLVTVITNVLALPFVEPAFFFVALVAFIGSVPQYGGITFVTALLGVGAQSLLACIEVIARCMVSLPYASVTVYVPGGFFFMWCVVVTGAYVLRAYDSESERAVDGVDTTEPY